MVGREDLLNAIALNSSMFNGARVAGPAIAGILVAVVGEGWCFLLNGVSYLAVIAGLFMMRIEKSKPVHDGAAPLEKLREGFRFARHTKPIRALLVLRGHCELHGAALQRADADLRRPDSARRGFGLRHADGRGGSGSDVRRAGDRDAAAIARAGKRRGVFGDGTGRFAGPVQRVALVLDLVRDSGRFADSR